MVSHRLALACQYINHWLTVIDEHSLQSPFIYEFYTRVVRNKEFNSSFQQVVKLRNQLSEDHTKLKRTDLGAGSRASRVDTISHLAKFSHQPGVSQLLYNLAVYNKPNCIMELGTSLGLSTLHLAAGAPTATIFTFEGDQRTSEIAQKNFDDLDAKNIRMVVGDIDHTLVRTLSGIEQIDLLFMDANHQFEPTLEYFNLCRPKFHSETMVVVDDIHWSKPMTKAWNKLRSLEAVTHSADFFYAGVLFFDPNFTKSHFVLSL